MLDRLRLPVIYPCDRLIANSATSRSQSASLPHTRERCDRRSAPVSGLGGSLAMARNNYGFEKRQRELSKERKKAEKHQRKLDRGNAERDSEAAPAEPGVDPVDDREPQPETVTASPGLRGRAPSEGGRARRVAPWITQPSAG